MLEKVVELTQLYDFYGELLTDKQKLVMSLYLMQDFSIVEIAEHLSISRQAVHDNIAKSSKILYAYEAKLGLLNRFKEREMRLTAVSNALIKIERQLKQPILGKIIDEIQDIAKV